jgi:hypothetical protein
VAEGFRQFGETYKPGSTKETLLSHAETLAIPQSFLLPSPMSIELPPLTIWEKAVLEEYRAPKRF